MTGYCTHTNHCDPSAGRYSNGCRGDGCRELASLQRKQYRYKKRGIDPDLAVMGDPNPYELPTVNPDIDQRWTRQAACADLPSETFFDPALEHVARSICAKCEVVEQCGEFARTTNQCYGFWAGINRTRGPSEL